MTVCASGAYVGLLHVISGPLCWCCVCCVCDVCVVSVYICVCCAYLRNVCVCMCMCVCVLTSGPPVDCGQPSQDLPRQWSLLLLESDEHPDAGVVWRQLSPTLSRLGCRPQYE